MESVMAVGRGYAAFHRRFLGLVVDGFVLFFALTAGVVALTETEVAPGRLGPLVLIAAVILYEPVLVSATGGTLGHHILNLRVSREGEDVSIGFFRALLRSWLKGLLGVFSFFFMLLTRRHQSLHDKLTRSVVVIHDLSKAMPTHYLIEREITPGTEINVSKRRRVLAILGYCLIVFVAFNLLPLPLVSNACILSEQCTDGENLVFSVAGFLLMIGCGTTVVLGWLGKLPGAR